MSTLTLVRHGQATPFEKDTDRLSPIGEAQSRKLAEYWLRYGVQFDEVYRGSLVRHQRSAEIIADWYRAAGARFPEIRVMPEFNEYDANGILTILLPAFAEQSADFKKRVDEFEANKTTSDRNRFFQRMFEALMAIWQQGHLELPNVESWVTFSNRVERGLKQVIKGGSRRRVAVFTSGGPIGVAVQLALHAPEQSALELNWRVRNCSITELLFSRDKLSLDWFNAIPHLDEPELRTYR